MKVHLKGLNACAMRDQKLAQYRTYLTANGHTLLDDPDEAEAIIVWTCAFRGDHRDSSLEKVREYLGGQGVRILVAGCLPDIAGEMLPQHERVIFANWNKDQEILDPIFSTGRSLNEFLPLFVEARRCEDAALFRQDNPGRDAIFHDQFIKLLIQEGCDFACSYCSEKLAFPPYRSFPPEALAQACRQTVLETDVYDVMLIGDSLGHYGHDIGTDLKTLFGVLEKIHPRLTISMHNLHLCDFLQWQDEICRLIGKRRLKHLNLPIQSASNRILSLMNRLYNKRDIETVFDMLQREGFCDFDTHIIVGFPGETEEDVRETVELLLRYKPRYVLASAYMEAPRAPSAAIPDKVSAKVIKARLGEISEILCAEGIICNPEQSALSKERIVKLRGS